MRRLLEDLRTGNQMLNIAGLTAAVMFLLAGPCWRLYVWALDLGPGGDPSASGASPWMSRGGALPERP